MTDARTLSPAAGRISRRDFIRMTALTSAGLMAGCAVNPVTGENQLMLVSEQWEINVDRENSPHQFSTDYGVVQDAALNQYLDQVGRAMAVRTHRPGMPYRFQGVNATYVNAYAFPGGSIAITRGILLTLEDEAELAALMGHELGHVNARHTAQQMSKGMLTQAVIGGLSVYAGTKSETYGQLAAQLGMLGAGALLASYSRDNEREADHLGMTYMVQSGYGTGGFLGLMDMLNSMQKARPAGVGLLFATHPMSQERYDTAVTHARTEFAQAAGGPLYRERFMDSTARLRKLKQPIELFQQGDAAMGEKRYGDAETVFRKGLKGAPEDYAGLTMLGKCMLAQEKYAEAVVICEKAKAVYPQEAQANHLCGLAKIKRRQYEAALADFSAYEAKLPGNPNTVFYKGYAHEGMGDRKAAAEAYYRFLQQVNQGAQAQHAYKRLVEWGVVKPESDGA